MSAHNKAPETVLVIDDSDGDALLAEMAITSALPATKVTHVDTGESALAILADDRFDAILLDLSMPGLTGFDLLSEIDRRDLRSGPVILVTNSTQSSDRREAAARNLPYVVKDSDYVSFCDSLIDTLTSL